MRARVGSYRIMTEGGGLPDTGTGTADASSTTIIGIETAGGITIAGAITTTTTGTATKANSVPVSLSF